MTVSQDTHLPIQKKSEPLRMVEMVFPNTTNHYGTMFGGNVLYLMDHVAFLASTRFSHQAMVTVSTENIDFYVPIKSGHLVELIAQVVYTGRTSLTVKVDLFSENPIQKSREHASQGYFHMVSVDENGNPIPIPALLISTNEEKEEWEYVQSLRNFRKNQKNASRNERKTKDLPCR